jgi:hypothetical protein
MFKGEGLVSIANPSTGQSASKKQTFEVVKASSKLISQKGIIPKKKLGEPNSTKNAQSSKFVFTTGSDSPYKISATSKGKANKALSA